MADQAMYRSKALGRNTFTRGTRTTGIRRSGTGSRPSRDEPAACRSKQRRRPSPRRRRCPGTFEPSGHPTAPIRDEEEPWRRTRATA